MFNEVNMIGKLTKQPQSGKYSIIVPVHTWNSHKKDNGEYETHTTFHTCFLTGQADYVLDWHKGDTVHVQGQLKYVKEKRLINGQEKEVQAGAFIRISRIKRVTDITKMIPKEKTDIFKGQDLTEDPF